MSANITDVDRDDPQISTWETVRRLSGFARPYWRRIGTAFLLLAGLAVADLLKPWPLKFIFDGVLTEKHLTGPTLYTLIGITVFTVGVSVFDGLFSYWQTYHINTANRSIVFDLRTALFDHVQRLSLQFHSKKRTGDLMTRVTGDVKALSNILTDSLVEVLYAAVLLIGMAGLLLWLDWQLALVAMLAAPVFYVFAIRYVTRVKELSRRERRAEGAMSSVLHESLGAIRITRVFDMEDEVRDKFQEQSRGSLETGLQATMAGARFSWVVAIMKAAVTAIVLGFGTARVMAGDMSPGELLVFVSYVRGFYKPIQSSMKHLDRITRASARAERVVEILDVEEGVRDAPDARPAPAFQGRIEYRGVGFAYEPGKEVLHDIDLTIGERQVTAIVGPTGVGKTTLCSLIPRLYDPMEGAVLIDGEDVRRYTLKSLRGQVSMVLQESVLFRTTVAENIAYGRPAASLHDIREAALAANAHEFIMGLEDGYDTVIGERGDTLSGGQRQRIAIARAMIRNAPILILDEPLIGLDAHSAQAVLEALDRLMEGKTVIVITHDLATVQRADYAVILEEGRIAQQGRVSELAAVEGPYRRLLQTQFREIYRTGDVMTARR